MAPLFRHRQSPPKGEIVSLALERLLGEWLQALLYYLLRLQFGLHGGVAVNHKNISLMYLLKRIQKFIWGQLRRFSLRELQVATDSFGIENACRKSSWIKVTRHNKYDGIWTLWFLFFFGNDVDSFS